MPHSQSTEGLTITPRVFTWASKCTGLTALAIIFEPSISEIVEIRFIKDGITCHDYDGKTAYVGGHPILVQDGIVILFKSRMDPSCNPVIELGDGGEDDTLRQDFFNIGEPFSISILEQRS
jgi:hypothetical protein